MKLKAILAFVGAGMLTFALSSVSFAGPPCTDTDGDTVCDNKDNCVAISNPGQRDDDLDGYGNICDYDLNQDCIAGGADVGLVGQFWLQSAPFVTPNPAGNGTIGAFDINEDNVIGGADIGRSRATGSGRTGPRATCARAGARAQLRWVLRRLPAPDRVGPEEVLRQGQVLAVAVARGGRGISK